jgi:hypothetical protein
MKRGADSPRGVRWGALGVETYPTLALQKVQYFIMRPRSVGGSFLAIEMDGTPWNQWVSEKP